MVNAGRVDVPSQLSPIVAPSDTVVAVVAPSIVQDGPGLAAIGRQARSTSRDEQSGAAITLPWSEIDTVDADKRILVTTDGTAVSLEVTSPVLIAAVTESSNRELVASLPPPLGPPPIRCHHPLKSLTARSTEAAAPFCSTTPAANYSTASPAGGCPASTTCCATSSAAPTASTQRAETIGPTPGTWTPSSGWIRPAEEGPGRGRRRAGQTQRDHRRTRCGRRPGDRPGTPT